MTRGPRLRPAGVEPSHGARRLTPGTSAWPAELDELEAPPAALWARGRLEILAERPRVALVGTRAPSPYGLAQAERFARALARRGVVVVSGLARGIDQAAHAAALEVGGSTVAVLGNGVDDPWPRGPLTRRLLAEGLVLSEYPPGTSPRRHHFPRRNRLLSGLSTAVVVLEAARASGSLITARWAADQGRAVYALPGRVDHPMSAGTHRLLREGASLIEAPEELFGEEATPDPGPLPPVLAPLRGETRTAGELAAVLGRDVADLLAELVTLELEGRCRRGPGGLWRLP